MLMGSSFKPSDNHLYHHYRHCERSIRNPEKRSSLLPASPSTTPRDHQRHSPVESAIRAMLRAGQPLLGQPSLSTSVSLTQPSLSLSFARISDLPSCSSCLASPPLLSSMLFECVTQVIISYQSKILKGRVGQPCAITLICPYIHHINHINLTISPFCFSASSTLTKSFLNVSRINKI